MIAVGNDVVDLEEERARPVHPRFAARIGAAPGDDLWFQFAAREAAWKALRKIEPAIRPIPRRFVVHPGGGSVSYGAHTVRLVRTRTDRFVHVVAWSGAGTPVFDVAAIGMSEPAAQSAEARRLLCLAAAGRLGVEPGELHVERPPDPGAWDGRGPPRLLHRGLPLRVDVSLSHHGRFVAWALLVA